MPRIVEVQSPEEFASHVNEKSSFGQAKGVVVDFTASWCGPCKMFAPIFAAASDKYPSITFLKVDVDQLQEVAQQCGVRAMPTCQAYVNAAKVDEFTGAVPASLTAMCDKVQNLMSRSCAGAGRKVGGSDQGPRNDTNNTGGADEDAAERRARLAAAAEARLRTMNAS